MADETRKSNYLGDVFGDWTVTARAEGGGDRKRRWEVTNVTTGVTMTVLQTGLRDLALTKEIQARQNGTEIGTPLTAEQAETALLARLDKQIAETGGATLAGHMLLAEARASVALDHDPECGTYSLETLVAPNHPFNDYLALAEAELAAGDPFALSPTTLAILADRNRCVDCEDGNHPDLSPTFAAGDGIVLEPVTVALSEEFKGRLQDVCVHIDTARKALERAETRLGDILEDLL